MNRPNKIYLLAAVFFIVAPLSVSGTASDGIKYARLAITAAMIGMGLFVYRADPLNSTTKTFTFFVVLFTAGALWSDSIFYALFNKSMFLMSALAGVYMVYTTKSEEELTSGIKLLALTGTIAGFLLFATYLQNPDSGTAGDRLAVGGMNANTIGAAAGPMFIFSFFLGLWRPEFKLRVVCFSSALLLAIVILGTGSRGATLMAIVGTLIATKPFLQKRASTVLLAIALPIGMLQIYAVATGTSVASKIPGLERIVSGGNKENTRAGMWNFALKKFNKSPIIGIGWLSWGKKSSANCHNAYLQILVEVGILGAAVFLASTVQLILRLSSVKYTLRESSHPELLALPLGLLASLAVHGMIEASFLFGTTALPLLLGFSIALIDRLPSLLATSSATIPISRTTPAIPRLDIRPRRRHPDSRGHE